MFCSLNPNTSLIRNGSWALPEVSGCNVDVYLYYPGMCSGDHVYSSSMSEVNYAALISKEYKQPVFTVWANDGLNPSIEKFVQDYLIQGKRPSFNKCCITGVTEQTYKGTGFSKGHMVAMADMGMIKCGTGNCSAGTFTTCNMSPQNEILNGDRWAKLEAGSRDCVSNKRTVVVYTGPLFGKNSQYCMNNSVCVGNDCEVFLHPSRKHPEHKDWYGETKYYSKNCQNSPIVPYAYYKVVIIRNKSDGKVFTFPIIMSQKTPTNNVVNASILTTGQEAWNIITQELSFLRFPYDVANNIQITDKDKWLQGNCPM